MLIVHFVFKGGGGVASCKQKIAVQLDIIFARDSSLRRGRLFIDTLLLQANFEIMIGFACTNVI
jgi:hypothetical protein